MSSDPSVQALKSSIAALKKLSGLELQKLPLLGRSLMLSALPDMPELKTTRKRLAQQLEPQLSQVWLETGNLYEVFSVLSALWQYNPECITGPQLAQAVGRLTQSEVTPGGPYYSNKTKGVIDIAANAQIATFIRLVAKPLPKLEAFLSNVIVKKRFKDPKLSKAGLIYLLTRACDSQALAGYMAKQCQQKQWQTPQRQAIALGILKGNLGTNEEQILATICKAQQPSGFWQGEAILSAAPKASARLITTALIIEALTGYWQSFAQPVQPSLRRKHIVIARAARRMFNACSEPLRSSALAAIEQTCTAERNFEITLLPQLFAGSLSSPAPLTNQQYISLGLANLYTWVAYTIYDDFLDDEGTPAQLPLANIAMRASLDHFRAALPSQPHFQRYVADVFTAMDEANAWEVSHCRFALQAGEIAISRLPKYGNCDLLAARSYAHALTPMAVLAQHMPSISTRRIESAFQHYLIARQLSDDLHDWLKDIQAGQASYVVTAILRDMRIKPGVYQLQGLLPAMRRSFRHTTMPRVGWRILWHINRSRQAFRKSELLKATDDIYLYTLLDNLALSAQRSLDKQAKSQALSHKTATWA